MQSLGQRAAEAYIKSGGFKLPNIAATAKRFAPKQPLTPLKPPTPLGVGAASRTPGTLPTLPAKRLPTWSQFGYEPPTRRDLLESAAIFGGGLGVLGGGTAVYQQSRRLSPTSPALPNWMAPVVSPTMPPAEHYVKQPQALPQLLDALPQDSRSEAMVRWHGEDRNTHNDRLPGSLITGYQHRSPDIEQAATQLLHRRNAYGAPLRVGSTRNGAQADADGFFPGITVSEDALRRPTLGRIGAMNHELEHIRQRGMPRVEDAKHSLTVPHEFAAGVGDMVFDDETYRQAYGQSSQARFADQQVHNVGDPDLGGGYAPKPALMAQYAREHGYFDGDSMTDLLSTPMGLQWVKQRFPALANTPIPQPPAPSR